MMTREAKIGLLMVAVLVGVFGFLVYKRVHRPVEALADQSVSSNANSMVDDDRAPEQFADDEPSFKRREPPRIVREIEFAANKVERKVEEFADEAVAEVTGRPREMGRREKPRMPKELTSDDDDFGQFSKPREINERTQELQVPDPKEDTFDNVPAQLEPPRALADDSESSRSNPFGDDASASTARPIEYGKPARKPIRQVKSDPFADDADDEGRSRESQAVEAAVEVDIQPEEPRYTRDSDNDMELSPREKRRAAPITLSDDDTAVNSSFQAPDSVDGPSYTIQPNDSFWSIARKRYGAGRYYMALALHNSQSIPDPKRMKPGVVISTPDVAVLERRYAEAIPKPAPLDSAPSVAAPQSRKSAEVESPGYFVSSDGAPHYRVGEQDTLTDIAKTYLGRTSRWIQILEMNRNVLRDGNDLKVGTVLRLPADASRVRMAETAREFR